MSTRRSLAAGTEVNGKLYVFGGYNDGVNYHSSVEIVDIDGGVTHGANMSSAVYGPCAVFLPDMKKVLIIGGLSWGSNGIS